MKQISLLFLSLLLSLAISAQKTPEQMGGVYHAYAVPVATAMDSLPAGFEPFYLSHYGRHGSRWLTSDRRYEWVLEQFADATNLTRKGRSVARRLQRVWANARGNGGKLTSLGAKQHEGIARRMLSRFPKLFADGATVEARSSVVDRCVKSMEAFVGQMRMQQPSLHIAAVTDSADMRFISYDSPDEKLLQRDTQVPLGIPAEAFAARLFKDPSRVENAENLMSELFTIASDMQDIEGLKVNLYDAFTRDEMHALYVWNCAKMFHQNGWGAESKGIPAQCAANLWQNIVDEADSAIATRQPRVSLRFGHDTGLYRLLAGTQTETTSLGTAYGVRGPLDELVPMGANLQLVFCHDHRGEVVVGSFLNERPFVFSRLQPVARTNWYRWTDIKAMAEPYIEKQKWIDRTRKINTMVGTDYAVTPAVGRYGKGSEEHGQTLPAVTEPHGQTFWTPQTQDTELKCIAPYYYRDSLFQGFRASHWIVGGCTQDYGSFTLMPMMGQLRLKPEQRATRFSHNGEISHPYYYAVDLPDEHLMAEMTGRSHSAIFRFTPQESGTMHIAVNPNSDEREGFVAVDTARRCVWGYNPVHRIYQGWGESAGFSGWFVVEFDRPITSFGIEDTVAYVSFDVNRGERVMARAATSFTSVEAAWHNLNAEIPHWDLLATRLELDSLWQQQLKTIDVESDDEAQVAKFYGALYRASMLPRQMSDCPGAPSTGQTHGAGNYYTDFSMWDIYRAQLPLLTIISPQRVGQMMQSLVTMYRRGGWMPIFPCWDSYTAAMIGDHGAAAIADAYVKGVRNFDVSAAYEGLRKNAFDSPRTFAEYRDGMGRRALKSYLKYGYIPMEDSVMEAFHTHEQVSRTLEYAYDDFCVAQLAQALGKRADYRALMVRAANWRNVLNPRTGWVDGRHSNGRWLGNQDLKGRVKFITEGAVVHYSFYVPQDVKALMEAMGGRERFIQKLDTLFGDGAANSYYWHGNEPCQQIPYLYAWAGQPWKTQRIVRQILNTEYLDVPGGLSGNDDAGQMSAWYVFSALGFYPVCPATPYYIIGTPSFRRATIGRLTIEAPNVSPDRFYIQSITWNGRPYRHPYITHDMITRGGTLRFEMGSKPNPTAMDAEMP